MIALRHNTDKIERKLIYNSTRSVVRLEHTFPISFWIACGSLIHFISLRGFLFLFLSFRMSIDARARHKLHFEFT